MSNIIYQSVFLIVSLLNTITPDNHVNMNTKMVSNSIFYDTRREGHSLRTGVHRSNSFTKTSCHDNHLSKISFSLMIRVEIYSYFPPPKNKVTICENWQKHVNEINFANKFGKIFVMSMHIFITNISCCCFCWHCRSH
jgi:hypothetical protein